MNDMETAPSRPHDNKKSPWRLRAVMEAFLLAQRISEISTTGLQNLDKIPEETAVIFVATHFTNVDMAVAASVVGQYKDIDIANQAIHHDPRGEFHTYLGIHLAGIKNFHGINTSGKGESKKMGFNPQDFVPMLEAMKSGKAILIAGFNPQKQGYDTTSIRGGIGAPYLAALAQANGMNVRIVPIAVKLDKPSEHSGKTTAKVHIGAPFEPEKANLGEVFSPASLDRSLAVEQLKTAGAMIKDTLLEL